MPLGRVRLPLGRYVKWAAAVLAGLGLLAGILLATNWPFTEGETVRSLEHFASSRVRIRSYRETFFPNPGYVAEGVSFWRDSKRGPVKLADVGRVECNSTWPLLVTFTHRVKLLQIVGLRVSIPHPVPPAMNMHPEEKEETTVTVLEADGSVLEIAPGQGSAQPVRFAFPALRLTNIEKQKSIGLETVVRNPIPPGELTVRSRFGPLDQKNIGKTPISGSFDIRHADLSKFQAIKGILAGRGNFKGSLAHCEVRGDVHVPDFEITSKQHAVPFSADFSSQVDGMHGNVSIEAITAHVIGAVLTGRGEIRDTPGNDAKTVTLDVHAERAPLQDLLRLFVKSTPPPVNGPISFVAHVALPPGNEEFLRKVRLDGKFIISDAEFTHRTTREGVEHLSERARGKKVKDGTPPEDVASQIAGDVRLRGGTATLPDISFSTPGAKAQGEGTYNLLTDAINFRGKLAMKASLSKAAGGAKSILLLPLDPFFKKGNAGAVVPIRITGTYSHPSFKLSLTGSK